MRPMNLQEAAQFLRMSKSSLYQRKDIPRYRRPGSRALLFDQDELEVWVKTGRIEPASITVLAGAPHHQYPDASDNPIHVSSIPVIDTLDIHGPGVYHRNPRYR
ncbi:MAG: helix-turn-helix domain-containing protein [Nitrospira sp.]|nr:MAG: helix-turn-helix domain-containing protein [Nitrospira sp.]